MFDDIVKPKEKFTGCIAIQIGVKCRNYKYFYQEDGGVHCWYYDVTTKHCIWPCVAEDVKGP